MLCTRASTLDSIPFIHSEDCSKILLMYQEDVTHFLPVLAHKKLVRTSLIVLPVTQYGDYVVSDVINVAHGERNQWMTLA